jgi:hypothetical protein
MQKSVVRGKEAVVEEEDATSHKNASNNKAT